MSLTDVNNVIFEILTDFTALLMTPPIFYFVGVFILFTVFALITRITKGR